MMKTPEQIADATMSHFGFSVRDPDRAMAEAAAIAAIEADRAQREQPMSDPLIELREWASTVSQFMAEDKSNDWREEIAQLEAIEERLDGVER